MGIGMSGWWFAWFKHARGRAVIGRQEERRNWPRCVRM